MNHRALPMLLPAFAAGAMIFALPSCERSQAQTSLGGKEMPTAPGIGSKCTVKLFIGNENQISLTSPEISGTLAATTADWICVKDSSVEHWIPRGRVLELRLTR